LLHFDYPGMQKTWFDWQTWLTAFGVGELKTEGSLHFSQYDQMIHAAMMGQGIALGRLPLIQEHIRSGALIAPFEKSVVGTRGYAIIEAQHARENPLVAPFRFPSAEHRLVCAARPQESTR
jgi:DNA-binding transcriptional LysR family regulator